MCKYLALIIMCAVPVSGHQVHHDEDLGFRVYGLGFRVYGLGLRVYGLGLRV